MAYFRTSVWAQPYVGNEEVAGSPGELFAPLFAADEPQAARPPPAKRRKLDAETEPNAPDHDFEDVMLLDFAADIV